MLEHNIKIFRGQARLLAPLIVSFSRERSPSLQSLAKPSVFLVKVRSNASRAEGIWICLKKTFNGSGKDTDCFEFYFRKTIIKSCGALSVVRQSLIERFKSSGCLDKNKNKSLGKAKLLVPSIFFLKGDYQVLWRLECC